MRCVVCVLVLLGLTVPAASLRAAPVPWKEGFLTAPARAVLDAANQVALPANDEVVILFAERQLVYGADGAAQRRRREVYQVRSEAAAAEWNAVAAVWEPWHEERPQIRARVIAPDGRVFTLDPKTIEVGTPRSPERDLYTDRSYMRAPLPGVTRGAVVEIEIAGHETRPLFEEGAIDSWTFVGEIPVQESRLVVDAPESLPVTFALTNGDGVRRSDVHTPGRLITTFEGGPWQARPPLFPDSPPELQRASFVLFTTGRSWKRVAERYSALVDAQLKGADLGAYARETTAKAKGTPARIAALLDRLNREIRYTGVEFGASTITPQSPAEVLARRFGDCKDKSTLLVGLLRALGIEAHVALLQAGVGADVDEGLPGLGAFNHAIVWVPGNPSLWIDPTDPYASPGDLPLVDQGRRALIIRAGTTGLVKTPTGTSRQNLTHEVREVTLSEDGDVRINERRTFAGVMGSVARQFYARSAREDVESALRRHAVETYKAKGVTAWSLSPPEDLSKPFTVEVTVDGGSMGAVSGALAILLLDEAPLFHELPSTLRGGEQAAADLPAALKGVPRTVDFVQPLPYSHELIYRIRPAHGFVVQQLPSNESVDFGSAHLTFTCRALSDGVVEARFLFDSGPGRLSPAALTKFNDDFAAYIKSPARTVKLVLRAEELLQAGKTKEALAALRRLDQEHPQSAHHAEQLATALLKAGLGEAARKQAQRATMLDPKSSSAQATLGRLLEHDLLGRPMQPGFDGKGAEEAFRRAIDLDPQNAYASAQYAVLAEYDEQGRHSWPAARLTAALERHERNQRLKNRDPLFDTNYLITLFRLQRFDQVIAKAKLLPATTTTSALALAAIALTKGPAEAIRQAAILVPKTEERPEALRLAAAETLRLRRYAESAALFDEAARGHQNSAGIRLLAGMLHQTRRFEKRTINRRDARDVWRGLMGLMASAGPPTQRELAAFLTEDQLTDELAVDSWKAGFARGAANPLGPDASLAETMDLAISREWNQVGDPRWGVWVHVPEVPVHQGLFFVWRPDGFRLLGSGKSVSVAKFGREALRLLDQGDREGAAYILDQCEDWLSPRRTPDPMEMNPFVTAWRGTNKQDEQAIRLAITLTRWETLTPADEDVLQRCRRQAADPVRAACEMFLGARLRRDDRLPESRAVAQSLIEHLPASDQARVVGVQLAMQAEDWEAAGRLARAALAQKPDHKELLLALATILRRQGREAESVAQLRKIIDMGQSPSGAYNNLAWHALAVGRTTPQAVDYARQAVRLTQRKHYSSLHTLAALLADAGEVDEARETLLEMLALHPDQQPIPADWFVVGRIAEQYDDVEAARAAYQRVGKPDSSDPENTAALAERRLRALAK